MYHLLITVGLFGLVASFHGLILAAGRSTYEMGRARNIPSILGKISPRFQTPANALFGNMIIGIFALLSGKTSEIIVISVFGALTLYIISMASILLLRKQEPELHRPFRVPFYPLFPIISLLIATISIIAMLIFNLKLGLIYFSILAVTFLLYRTFKPSAQ
ncbi:amino acid permease [Pedobacter sp. NJ-S-72]